MSDSTTGSGWSSSVVGWTQWPASGGWFERESERSHFPRAYEIKPDGEEGSILVVEESGGVVWRAQLGESDTAAVHIARLRGNSLDITGRRTPRDPFRTASFDTEEIDIQHNRRDPWVHRQCYSVRAIFLYRQ